MKYDESGARLRDLRKPCHFTIDNRFLDDGYAAVLGPHTSMVYNVLCRCANLHTSSAFPSCAEIARITGISLEMVRKANAELLEYKIIAYVSLQRKTTYRNEYRLVDKSKWVPLKRETISERNVS